MQVKWNASHKVLKTFSILLCKYLCVHVCCVCCVTCVCVRACVACMHVRYD